MLSPPLGRRTEPEALKYLNSNPDEGRPEEGWNGPAQVWFFTELPPARD